MFQHSVDHSVNPMDEHENVCGKLNGLGGLRKAEAKRKILEEFGDVDGLCKILRTCPVNGITSGDFERRRVIYGSNAFAPPESKSFSTLALEALNDRILIMLLIAAFASFCLTFLTAKSDASEARANWLESGAILITVIAVVLATAGNEYSKEQKFRRLRLKLEHERMFSVVRDGRQQLMEAADIVVGDICLLKYGDCVPADGVIIRCNDLKMDESSLTGESKLAEKGHGADLMILSGTHVLEGSGRMVVTAVGENSQTGIIMQLLENSSHRSKPGKTMVTRIRSRCSAIGRMVSGRSKKATNIWEDRILLKPLLNANTIENGYGTTAEKIGRSPLHRKSNHEQISDQSDPTTKSILYVKLSALATRIGYVGVAASVSTIFILFTRFIIRSYIVEGKPFCIGDLQHFLDFTLEGISILIMVLPDGLPLAVTFPLAYAVKEMMKHNILVRHLSACETMGSATTICMDKTGTLTMNKMTVSQCYIGGEWYRKLPDFGNLPASARESLVENICVNSSYASHITTTHSNGCCSHLGNRLECGLLNFVSDLKQDYKKIRQQFPEQCFIKVFTFNSSRKYMATVIPIRTRDISDACRVLVKGASEILLDKCSSSLDCDGREQPLSRDQREILKKDVIESMSASALRTLCIAYKDVPFPKPDETRDHHFINWNDEEKVVSDLTCVGVLGLEDPVRPEAPEAIRKCQRAGITVRMITGDNLHTARAIARKCGIIDELEDGSATMEGRDFNTRIRDSRGTLSQERFDMVWPYLRVLARVSPLDKYNMVKGIIKSAVHEGSAKGQPEIVAVTGDGTNDAPAMKAADVGLAMGTGTDVAKEAADIILTNNNFDTIVKAVMYGRSIYESIARFLQFQLTVNAVTVAFMLVALLGTNDSPIKAIQFLWMNLIGDMFSALSFAGEPATEELLKKPVDRYGRKRPLVTAQILESIVKQALLQCSILCLLLYAGASMLQTEDARFLALNSPPSQHFTIIFNAFVLMTLFNEINCRRTDGERNVFKALHRNYMFCSLWLLAAILQIIIVEFGDSFFLTAPLRFDQWLWCIFFGLLVLPWHQITLSLHFISLCKISVAKMSRT